MKISITFDVEIWCGSWEDLDKRFPPAFERYVFGPEGYALPKTLETLNRHGLKGVFFVEPLFAYRFGLDKLQQITGLILNAGHEIQLHLHPEWVDEIDPAILDDVLVKRPYMHQYGLPDQTRLVAKGIEALQACGVPRPSAFRAGSYACNRDTFRALAENQIYIDTSANFSYPGSAEDLAPEERYGQPFPIEQISEYPVTVFVDGFSRPRHWQVGAVGFAESVDLIEKANQQGYRHLVLVSHNFEMLVPGKSRVDRIVARRFERLCSWLGERPENYPTVGFQEIEGRHNEKPEIRLNFWPSAIRMVSQLTRRLLSTF